MILMLQLVTDNVSQCADEKHKTDEMSAIWMAGGGGQPCDITTGKICPSLDILQTILCVQVQYWVSGI